MSLTRRPLRSAWHYHATIEMDKAMKAIQKAIEVEIYGKDYYHIYKDSVLLIVLRENNHGK